MITKNITYQKGSHKSSRKQNNKFLNKAPTKVQCYTSYNNNKKKKTIYSKNIVNNDY